MKKSIFLASALVVNGLFVQSCNDIVDKSATKIVNNAFPRLQATSTKINNDTINGKNIKSLSCEIKDGVMVGDISGPDENGDDVLQGREVKEASFPLRSGVWASFEKKSSGTIQIAIRNMETRKMRVYSAENFEEAVLRSAKMLKYE